MGSGSLGTWVLDLDGVLWLSGEEIPGSAAAVARLRAAGARVLFATNNAEPTLSQLVQRLAAIDVDADPSELVTSGQAAATLVSSGDRVLACGGPGLVEALEARGAAVVDQGPADAVIVGMTRSFDYELLTRAALGVRAGATLIGTNEDPTHPTPQGLFPGSGSLVAAVATAAETQPLFAGKPHEPMADLISSRTDDVRWMVGDRPATDGLLARRLQVPFALVLSGVTTRTEARPPRADADGGAPQAQADDLAALVSQLVP